MDNSRLPVAIKNFLFGFNFKWKRIHALVEIKTFANYPHKHNPLFDLI